MAEEAGPGGYGKSTASTLKECPKCGGEREIIAVILRDDRKNLAQIRNTGAAAARGEILLTIDADSTMSANFLEEVDFGLLEDGTAIGLAVATGLNRLRDSKAESKVMVLLTDGVNNAGFPDPVPAAEMARTLEVKMYAVGVGKPGKAPYPVDDPIFGKRYRYLPDQIDEEMLRQMAKMTGGLYFRAKTPEMLADIYDQISALEKTEIKSEQYTRYRELFSYFALAGLGLFLFELLLTHTRFRRIP